jgi:putative DNA primase/helicase
LRSTTPSGARNDFGLCVAGYLLRNGESEEDVRQLLTNARLMQPEEPTKGSREGIFYAVQSTVKRMERDQEFTGGKTLNGMVPKLAERLAQALGWERANAGEGRRSYMRTDDGNALRFVDRHGELLRYCPPWKTWLVWDGQRWMKGAEGAVLRLARETARSIFEDAATAPDEETQKAIAKWAVMSQSTNRIQGMITLAKSDERVEVAPDVFDADPWLLNVENGTLNLRTGELQEHDPTNHITKLAPAPYEPSSAAPAWDAFVRRVLPDEEVRAFVQQSVGYSATGDISEQCIFIHYGFGQNGKSTFQEAITAALGDYAMKTPTDTLLVKRSGGIPNDVARLKGARYVTASETEDGRRLSEALVKELTGGDTITARFLHAEYFDFRPTHAIHLSTNHRPEIRGTDIAIWRRIRLVPWWVTIEEKDQDKALSKKLRDELPGILAWIVRGCAEWRESGLYAPEEVRQATAAYRSEMDVLAGFLADCCKVGEDEEAFATPLWQAWKHWSEASGETVGTQTRFGRRLNERGFERGRDSKTGLNVWSGLSLLDDWVARAGVSLNSSSVRFAGNSENPERFKAKSAFPPSTGLAKEKTCKKGSNHSDRSETVQDPPSGYTLIADSEGFETYIKELEEGA